MNRSVYLIFCLVLILLGSGCIDRPYNIYPVIKPGHRPRPVDEHQIELKKLKQLPVNERIEAYIKKYPESGHRHIGWCGTPMGMYTSDFEFLLDNVPTKDIIPFLEHEAPYLRSAVHSLLKKKGFGAKSAINQAFDSGSARIKLELLQYVKPDATDDEKFRLLDEIIHNRNLKIFETDIRLFDRIRHETRKAGSDSYKIEDYPFDVITFYRRLMMEEDFGPDRSIAFQELGKFKEAAAPAVPDLITILNSDESAVENDYYERGYYDDTSSWKTEAARVLGEIGPKASDAIPHLIKAVDSSNSSLSIYSTTALYLIGHEKEAMLRSLIERFKVETDPKVLPTICVNLGRIGSPAKDAIPLLVNCAKNEDRYLRINACSAIAKIDGSDERVYQIQLENLKSPNAKIRMETLDYIGSSKFYARAKDAIYNSLKDPDSEVKFAACYVLHRHKEKSDRVLDALIDVVGTVPPIDRVEEAIGMIVDYGEGAKKAIPSLMKMIECKHNGKIDRAIDAIIKLGGDYNSVVDRLIQLSKHEDWEIACAVMHSIGKLGDKANRAIPVLVEQNRSGVDKRKWASNDAIRNILKDIKPGSNVSVDDLILLFDCGPYGFMRDAVGTIVKLNMDTTPVAKRLIKLCYETKESRDSHQYLYELKKLGNLDPSLLPDLRLVVINKKGSIDYTAKEIVKDVFKSITPEKEVNIQHVFLFLDVPERELSRLCRNVIIEHGGTYEQIVDEYLDIIKNQNQKQGKFATEMLSELGANAISALPVLAEIRKNKQHPLNNEAYYTIGSIIHNIKPDSGVDPADLAKVMVDLDWQNARRAKEKIIELGGNIDDATKDMKISPETLNSDILWTLGSLGAKAVDSLPVLYEVATDMNHPMQHDAEYAIRQIIKDIKPETKVSEDILYKILVGPDNEIVRNTVKAIINTTGNYDKLVDALIGSLSNTNPKVRLEAIQALRDLGAKSEKALPILKALPESDDKDYNSILRYAIKKIEMEIKKA